MLYRMLYDLCRCSVALSCLRAGRANVADCRSCWVSIGSTFALIALDAHGLHILTIHRAVGGLGTAF